MTKDELSRVKDVVNTYFEAATYRKLEKFMDSWHPDAKMSFIREGQVTVVPRSYWEKFCEQEPDPNDTVECKIEEVDLTGNVASVKTKMFWETKDRKVRFTDYLTLLKSNDDKWLIINKSYHTEHLDK